ncbi:efflux RND transporter periplasmic adaptor subunit [Sphingomonas sp. Leaf25]|uniref:efflux RND transporter periplasmic adaptor subunit n=1 Tax=Sphingomonas sp. Leaf25 TaxID=1735692 RepID=UPI0006FC6130|nr:efflux RND transporter periplasmic adaptor subunit [Sphingomonas sp. Leaf25]KQM98776.1 metal transporter [Sphingomonas sp. Leaf25]
MTSQRLYAGAAIGIVLAAAAGFGAARLTSPVPTAAPAPPAEAEHDEAPTDTVAIDAAGIAASQITVVAAAAGSIDAILSAAATVASPPDAQAVLAAGADGTVTRIFKRVGDPVARSETIALIESRDASSVVADRAGAAARVTLAERQLARERSLLSQGVSPRADLETAQAALAVARADAARAVAAAGALRIARDGRSVALVSPIAGRITAAPATLGQYVAAATELFRVADATRLTVTAALPPADAARVRPGDRVELTIDPGRIVPGTVRSATGVVDPETRAATVVVDPGAGASTLSPGQLVQARIFTRGGTVAGGVTVPAEAVQTLGERTVVFVATPTGFRAQDVIVGTRSGERVQILRGLAAATRIAAANAFLLKAELGKSEGDHH